MNGRSGCRERAAEDGTPRSTPFRVQDPVKHRGPAVVVAAVSAGSRDSSTKNQPPSAVVKQNMSRRRHAESPGFSTSSDLGKRGHREGRQDLARSRTGPSDRGEGVPSKSAWTDTRSRHRSMMYASSPRLAREQGHGDAGRSGGSADGHQAGCDSPPANEQAAHHHRPDGPRMPPDRGSLRTTTTPQAASRTAERSLTRDREIISRLSMAETQSGGRMHPWRCSRRGTDCLARPRSHSHSDCVSQET